MSCVVVYARQPLAGRVKTRLAATVGNDSAARVYRLLLDHTLQQTCGVGAHVVLALSEAPSGRWCPDIDVRVEEQASGDLGQRLAATFSLRFAEGWTRVVVVGSDCPGLTTGHLRSALDVLDTVPAVLGPAADGGYWLVGQRSPGTDLFSGIPWSSPDTMAATRRRLQELRLDWQELEVLRDIDTDDDLGRALASDRLPDRLKDQLAQSLDISGGGR